MLKKLKNFLAKNVLLSILGLAVIIVLLNTHFNSKDSHIESYSQATSGGSAPQEDGGGGPGTQGTIPVAPQVVAAHPVGENEVSASVSGVATSSLGLPPSCSTGTPAKPGDLLPKTGDNAWSQLTPNLGNGDLTNVNLLDAGYHTGIDTVLGTLRNANLQVRSEPPNPQTKVSPWQNTTIEPDLMRVPLEIGCGPQ